MDTKKTIQINPELFKISKTKTRKKKEKTVAKNDENKSLLSALTLKNKLLKRIKEHRMVKLQNNTHFNENNLKIKPGSSNSEFDSAVNYLSDLSKVKKLSSTLNRLKKKNESSISTSTEDTSTSKTNIPYGCLKNGSKQTYREWKETSQISVRPPSPPKKNTDEFVLGKPPPPPTEEKEKNDSFDFLAGKLKDIQHDNMNENLNLKLNKKELDTMLDMKENFPTSALLSSSSSTGKEEEEEEKKRKPWKQYRKKTTVKKYRVGKLKDANTVSILISSLTRRKKVVDTKHKLESIPLAEKRKYLHDHGIIKIGAVCPNDVLKKTFEDAIMSAEVTNINPQVQVHNLFLSQQQQ
jgi:hypothetical protein